MFLKNQMVAMVVENSTSELNSGAARLSMRLVGTFGLFQSDGTQVAIPHLKNQAILVLLATTTGQERSRRWLEAILWSDRAPNEAKQSLRTALSELRRALGSKDGIITSNNATIRLVPGTVKTDLDDRQLLASDPDILEGMDIRDDAFNDWLTVFRSEHNNARASSELLPEPNRATRLKPLLRPMIASGSSRFEMFVAQAMLDFVDQNILENIGISFTAAEDGMIARQSSLLVRSTVVEHHGQSRLSLRVEDPATGKRIWHCNSTVPSDQPGLEHHPEILKMAFGTSSVVVDAIRVATERTEPGHASAEALLARAIVEMFSFDSSKLRIAEVLLQAAGTDLPAPVLSMWKALCYQFMYAEGVTGDRPRSRALALSSVEAALAEAPDNAQVLAIASCVRQLLGDDPDVGLTLGEQAVVLNPSNAFGHVGTGFALLRQGKVAEASISFDHAERLASGSVFLHWIKMFSCLCAIVRQDFASAMSKAEAASVHAPNFRSALRHLYALKLYQGDRNGAQRALSQLTQIEPGFSLKMVRSTPEYPLSIIRNSPLIELRDLR